MQTTMTTTPPHSVLIYLFVGICASVLHYFVTSARFRTSGRGTEKSHQPPLVPHVVPVFGNFPLRFFWEPLGFAHTYFALWQRQSVRLRTLFQDIYIIQGANDIVGLFKQRETSTLFLHRIFLANAFLLPRAAVETYCQDGSGKHARPYPGTQVEHRNRVEFHIRNSIHHLLLGPGQSSLFRRFYSNAIKRLGSLDVGQEWVHIPDFLDIFKSELTAANVDALAGPGLLQRHPTFVEDIWTIDENITGLVLKMPRFLNMKAHKARDRAINAVLDWQAWANQNFTLETVDEDGNDPFWGCGFFRERQQKFSNMDGFDPRAIASEDLSFIWSANTNAVIASFWITLQVFRDVTLLEAVREEVQSCRQVGPENQLLFDIPKLLHQPLLQAVFAENLRLRVHGFLIRRPEQKDLQVNNWTIRRNHWCIASSTPASMDSDFWCKGEGSAHPVDQFWPGRFLKRDSETNALTFSLAGTEGYWVPFGGGPHACPGRVFTKRQNILALAVMVMLYDCKVLAMEKDMALKSGTYPLGSISPQGRVLVKMRRRDLL